MPSAIHINSAAEFRTLLSTSTIVIADFYADWCGPCKAIAPLYEQLASKHSKPKLVAFAKVNVDTQSDIARQYSVSAMPTFLIFRSGAIIQTLRGADPRGLTTAVENAVKMAGAAKSIYSTPGHTLGGPSGRPVQSLRAPLSWSLNGFFNAIITFFGLYFISLFSIDPYASAEASPFNIHREPPRPKAPVAGNGGVKLRGAATGPKKLGTISDIRGD